MLEKKLSLGEMEGFPLGSREVGSVIVSLGKALGISNGLTVRLAVGAKLSLGNEGKGALGSNEPGTELS